ncbi:MAG TPA: STAS domain-containing protein [Baekduia sp.]|nr:STAS domain-containing protein [Baekduia sp.]
METPTAPASRMREPQDPHERERRDAVRTTYVGSTLRLDVDDHGEAPRVALAGELDLAAMRRLRTVLRDLRRRAPRRIEVDLERLSLIETVTAASLVREREAARREGVELELSGAGGTVRRLLELAQQRVR